MSKIYSAVDADECVKFIGQEGYFGDSLHTVQDKQVPQILKCVYEQNHTHRFVDEYGRTWILFQPIEKTDFAIAKGLLGKVMKEKETNRYVIFTEIRENSHGVVLESVNIIETPENILKQFELVEYL